MIDTSQTPGTAVVVRWGRWLALAVLTVVALRAHDAMSSSAVAQLTPARLELTVDLGAEAAWLFLGESIEQAPDIDRSMDRLKAQAGKVYLLSWQGKEIKPRETSLDRRDDGGVAFKFVYDPPTGAGKLRFEALFLKRMAEGHLTVFTLVDADDNVLNGEILSPRQTSAEFALPVPPPAAAKR